MNQIKINVIKLKQSKWTMYIGKINAYTLYKMSKADIMSITDNGEGYSGIQRELNKNRISEIKDYLESDDATFPNSIILNLNKKYLVNESDYELTIKVSENTFSIIDGQHRLSGFENEVDSVFELNISIFIGLETNDEQRIFNTINTEHTKVSPSHSFYTEINDSIDTPRKFAAKVSSIFATDITSPWYQRIKLLGKKDDLSTEGRISLDTFAVPIVDSIYKDKYFYKIRNFLMKNNNNLKLLNESKLSQHKSYLWEFYIKNDVVTFYKIYSNYFNSIKKTLPNDWENPNSILTKTTGYNAFLKLFKDLIIIGLENRDVSEEFFTKKLEVLKDMDGTFNSKIYAASGGHSSSVLYEKIRDKVITLFN